ncbi:MAG: extracellular solute-binding protein [Chloroflexi bacterium]|nr:extracellular solute-binding protein [Chloroflexota bacterium]
MGDEKGIDRREFLKKAAIAGTALMGLEMLGCAPQAAPPAAPTAPAVAPTPPKAAATPTPSEADRVAQLIEGAKKEGKLMYYGHGPADQVESRFNAFMKKYPFIKVENFVAPGEQAVEKLMTEARAGKTQADVSRVDAGDMYKLLNEGLLMAYDSPERKFYPPEAKDKDGFWTLCLYAPHVMVYNTKLVTAADAPKSYEDMLDPKWKGGKLGLESECLVWFSYMLQSRGTEKGLDLMKKLAAQNPKLVKGHSALMKLTTAGDIPVMIMNYQYMIQSEIEKGAPLKWVAINPVPVTTSMETIIKGAPHPNAAKLAIDWLLSEEGQKENIKSRLIPPRIGMKPEPASIFEGVQLVPVDPKLGEAIQKNSKLFRDIFGTI